MQMPSNSIGMSARFHRIASHRQNSGHARPLCFPTKTCHACENCKHILTAQCGPSKENDPQLDKCSLDQLHALRRGLTEEIFRVCQQHMRELIYQYETPNRVIIRSITGASDVGISERREDLVWFEVIWNDSCWFGLFCCVCFEVLWFHLSCGVCGFEFDLMLFDLMLCYSIWFHFCWLWFYLIWLDLIWLEEEPSRRNIWSIGEDSGRQLGSIWEAGVVLGRHLGPRNHPGDTQETPRRHPGDTQGTQEAPRGSEPEKLRNYKFLALFTTNLTNGQKTAGYTQQIRNNGQLFIDF